MLTAIHLYSQYLFEAGKIEDEFFNGMLSAKLLPHQLMVAE
jgi:hypothetical protein